MYSRFNSNIIAREQMLASKEPAQVCSSSSNVYSNYFKVATNSHKILQDDPFLWS